MIDEIHIENIALIASADFCPSSGLNVVTGESGAGKTALLQAYNLLIGQRASSDMLRCGAENLLVEARIFTPDDPENGHIVSRQFSASKRSRITIDGHMAQVNELVDLCRDSVDICNQHEHQKLFDAKYHQILLDAWGSTDITDKLEAYTSAFVAYKKALDAQEEFLQLQKATTEMLDQARFELEQIMQVDPQPQELDTLQAQLSKAEHVQTLLSSANTAYTLLHNDGAILDELSQTLDELSQAARYDDEVCELCDRVENTQAELEDVAQTLRSYRDAIDLDESHLLEMQQRMANLQGLIRKFGPTLDDVLQHRDRAQNIIDAQDTSSERADKLAQEVATTHQALIQAADALDTARKKVAQTYAEHITEVLHDLHMEHARISFSFERLDEAAWTKTTPSHIEMMYQPAKTTSARPLKKIASGGEMSRVLLAIKVLDSQSADTETLIFDEVDAGVGGATACDLARVLQRLAQKHQVIVITHLAQIAAVADTHFCVSKENVDGLTQTCVKKLNAQEREYEIARMLTGTQDELSLQQARKLIQQS